MKVDKTTRDLFLSIQKDKKVTLEGNILKIIEADEADVEFSVYLSEAIARDKNTRKKRLEITKQVQDQNAELLSWKKENQDLTDTLKLALAESEQSKSEAIQSKEEADLAREAAEIAKAAAESAKDSALGDLDILQKKSQTELISTIVKVALAVILSVGVITTIMYGLAMWTGKDTQIIGSTWSNMFGILLTNAFSIVGTIMGVKYASDKSGD